jgi:site-specific DNA-cytosine methylase
MAKEFRFIDLFAGIGGIRLGFESIGGKCVFSSEWDETAPEVKGCIVYKGVVHPVNSKQDIQEILSIID